jgi:hypothetical protein
MIELGIGFWRKEMQTSQIELSAQQLVLAFLGFYKGPIDGIWSTDSILAMKAFERDDSFCPGVPTNGLPFGTTAKLPKGMYWDKKLVNHRKLSPEQAAELLRTQVKAKAPAPVSAPVQTPKQNVQTPVKAQPVEESEADDDAQE